MSATKGNSRSKFETRVKGRGRRTQVTAKKRRQLLAEPDIIHLGPMDAEENPFKHGDSGPI